jgi:translation initiation factor 2-alpha kinase 4
MRSAVADVLSKLNIQQWTWQKIRNELRSPLIGVSATSLDDLQRFDFRGITFFFRLSNINQIMLFCQLVFQARSSMSRLRSSCLFSLLFILTLIDTPSKAFQKLKAMFEGTDTFERASSAIAHLNEVVGYLRRLEVHSKVFVSPLSSLKEKFYKGGVLFSCLYDTKRKDVFAAGGRYDSLVREHRPRIGSHSEDRHAVGFSLAWEKLSTSMARFRKSSSKTFLKKAEEDMAGIWTIRRVSSFHFEKSTPQIYRDNLLYTVRRPCSEF